MKQDIYQHVTDVITASLEQAQVKLQAGLPFEYPWVTVEPRAPRALAGTPYRGINFVLLSLLGGMYPSATWGTYKGWQAAGGQVRKGERGTRIVFWSPIKVRDASDGEIKSIPFATGYTVFAAEQVEGIDAAKYITKSTQALPNIATRIDHAEIAARNFLTAQGVRLTTGTAAFYSPAFDTVEMPPIEAFKSTEGYYSVLFHELTHSTGHEKRLDRNFKRFNAHAIALEELVAEFGAAMCCARLGLPTLKRDDAIYIARWLEALKSNPRAVISAAASAQHACDLILGVPVAASEQKTDSEALAA